jgi:RNA polymerase sigma-70 factor (ECF subfamily)
MVTTDRELVLAAQAGDADAFGHLVARHQRAAYGHAVALLGRREAAQDALQDSFLAAFRALRQLAPERPFFPWFYVILRNRCFSMLRSRRVTESLDESCVSIADPSPNQDVADVREALSQLSAEDREILVLKYIDGHRYRQIAELLGVPIGTVTSRLHAARRRLADQLRERRNVETR